MSDERWSGVDRYFEDALVERDPALEAALRSAVEELGWR